MSLLNAVTIAFNRQENIDLYGRPKYISLEPIPEPNIIQALDLNREKHVGSRPGGNSLVDI
jgi:hypothetical protein